MSASTLNSSIKLSQWFPIANWIKSYNRTDLGSDCFAGIITAILLVPQGIAYAILAGLPAQVGLYASILPPLMYVLTGTSRTMSVGPVSIAAIMIAAALSAPQVVSHGDPLINAMVLAAETGLILLLMAVFRMGTLVNFISHPVLTGFTSGAALLIITSQISPLLGIDQSHCGMNWNCYLDALLTMNSSTVIIGIGSIIALLLFDKPLGKLLQGFGFKQAWITAICKSGPLLVVIGGAVGATYFLDDQQTVKTVGAIPPGLPVISLSGFSADTWGLLFPSAAFIALIAYVESVAIAKVTARLRRQRIDPNQELIALGTANLAASVSGGMPVAGGFSRTMVNFSAGAVSQIAMLVAAVLLAIAVSFFTELFSNILKASLAAIILVAIAPLVKVRSIINIWIYDRADALAEMGTFGGVLILGIEQGLGLGIAITLLGYLWRTSHPHIAVVGEVPNTEHFRNIERHTVATWPSLLLIRVDENLTFANAGYLEDYIYQEIAKRSGLSHLVLIFTSVSYIDATALETLENLIISLRNSNITVHLAEVKGPVMDRLQTTDFVDKLSPGEVFLTTHQAAHRLAKS
ncbi:MAG: sulfate permease [Gammaproteobacteria bacterium]|nr:sulfate permease [Gammaproteobacteria bacterium]